MNIDRGHRKIASVLLCGVAEVALIAAGFVLFDARDDLKISPDGEGAEFVSYSVEAEGADQASSPDEEVADESDLHESDFGESDLDRIEWEELAVDDQWEVLEPRKLEEQSADEEVDEAASDEVDAPRVGQSGSTHQGPTGRLVVITNFTRARVTVNGDTYPSYSDDGQNRGLELPANQSHEVHVEFDDNERIYDITLSPGEERLLMVELTGMSSSGARPDPPSRAEPDRRRAERERASDDDIPEDEGRITVYSRPRGSVYVGEESTGERTPSTIEVDPGRHEVQVRYEGGEMSETKTVRVRGGSRVKLFFRDDD